MCSVPRRCWVLRDERPRSGPQGAHLPVGEKNPYRVVGHVWTGACQGACENPDTGPRSQPGEERQCVQKRRCVKSKQVLTSEGVEGILAQGISPCGGSEAERVPRHQPVSAVRGPQAVRKEDSITLGGSQSWGIFSGIRSNLDFSPLGSKMPSKISSREDVSPELCVRRMTLSVVLSLKGSGQCLIPPNRLRHHLPDLYFGPKLILPFSLVPWAASHMNLHFCTGLFCPACSRLPEAFRGEWLEAGVGGMTLDTESKEVNCDLD